MMEVSYNGDVLDVLIAILSCAWSYQVIGEHHANIPNATQHPIYGEWIKGYSSEQYRKDTQELIDLTDKLGEGISQKRICPIKRRCKLCWNFRMYHFNMHKMSR